MWLAAATEDRVVVTSDADFGGLLALGGATLPSVVLLRSSDHLTPDEQSDLLLTALPLVVQDLEEGAVVSLTSERVRVRSLPIRRGLNLAVAGAFGSSSLVTDWSQNFRQLASAAIARRTTPMCFRR